MEIIGPGPGDEPSGMQLAQWAQLWANYHRVYEDYKHYLAERTNLRRVIMRTVSERLLPGYIDDDRQYDPRWLLQQLQARLTLSEDHMRQKAITKYDEVKETRYTQWPRDGPGKWIESWRESVQLCQRWSPVFLSSWQYDFARVWDGVDAWTQGLCGAMMEDIKEGSSQ